MLKNWPVLTENLTPMEVTVATEKYIGTFLSGILE